MSGFFWDSEVVINEVGRGAKNAPLKTPPAPDWEPPTEFRSFADRPFISLDTETVDPDLQTKGPGVRRDGRLVGIALALSEQDADYYPIDHKPDPSKNVDKDQLYNFMRHEAKSFKGAIIGANLNYDLDYLAEQGIEFKNATMQDVQIAEPLLDELQRSYSLDNIASRHLNDHKKSDMLADLYGPNFITQMDQVHAGHAAEYAIQDVRLPLRLMAVQRPLLESQGLTALFDIESRLMPLLLHMRRVGVRVDSEKAEIAHEKLGQRYDALHKALDVDIWSADALAALFRAAGIEYEETPTGRPSFRKPWLDAHPSQLAKDVAKMRSIDKLRGTFLKGYIIDSHINGRIHCQFNQLRSDDGGTVSGRLSSSNPNMQNIPVRDPELGPLMRSMFIPEDEMEWGSADWSQIEFRFLVHYAVAAGYSSADSAATAYKTDPTTDFHAIAAELTRMERGPAKNINFGVVYGMGEETMALNMGVSIEEAAPILEQFHTRLPFIKQIFTLASNRARRKRMIRTILGRRRRFPDGNSTHKALNGLLQGSAADLMKKAMVEMWDAGIFDILVPHLTVHDEMDVSIPKTKQGREAFKELIYIMENTVTLEVPILATAKTGVDWSQCK